MLSDGETGRSNNEANGSTPPRSPIKPVSPLKFYRPLNQGLSSRPDTSNLVKNDICYQVSRDSGILKHKRRTNLVKIFDQQTRAFQLSPADRCYVGCQLVPNQDRPESCFQYRCFALCGTYENDGAIFISSTLGCTIRIFSTFGDVSTPKKIISSYESNQHIPVHDVSVSPDGGSIICSSLYEYLLLSSTQGTNERAVPLMLKPSSDPNFTVYSVKFFSHGDEVICSASDSSLYVYNFTQQKCVQRFPVIHEGAINSVCFADRGPHILFTGGDDGLVKVWDRRVLSEKVQPVRRPVGILAGHRNTVTFLDSKGDGRYLISNSADQSIKLWDLRRFAGSNGVQATLTAAANQQWDYRFQPIPASELSATALVPLPGDVSVMTYRGHVVLKTQIRCRFSPIFITGQRFLYTGCASGRIIIYDLLTGDRHRVLIGHSSLVRDVSWHPYSPVLRSSSFDKTCKEWVFGSNKTLGPYLRARGLLQDLT